MNQSMSAPAGCLKPGTRELLFYGLNIAVPLLLGALLYFLFRPDTYISRLLHDLLGIQWQPASLYAACPLWLQSLSRNFLPDILWAYALTFSVALIWWHEKHQWLSVFVICALFEIGLEACQKIGIMSGTFDWLDIIFEICITAFATLLIKTFKEKWK